MSQLHFHQYSYSYFPLHAISSTSAAGWYWTTWYNTGTGISVLGTVYNNTYTNGQLSVISSPTPFSTTGPGAYTQTTSTLIAGPTYAMPGNSMGPNGALELTMIASTPNDGNLHIIAPSLGGTQVGQCNTTGNLSFGCYVSITNAGVTNSQIWDKNNGSYGDFSAGSTAAVLPSSIDTTTAQNVSWNSYIATATDYLILERYSIKLYPHQ